MNAFRMFYNRFQFTLFHRRTADGAEWRVPYWLRDLYFSAMRGDAGYFRRVWFRLTMKCVGLSARGVPTFVKRWER